MNSCRISFVSFVYFLISDFIMKIFNYLSETAVMQSKHKNKILNSPIFFRFIIPLDLKKLFNEELKIRKKNTTQHEVNYLHL